MQAFAIGTILLLFNITIIIIIISIGIVFWFLCFFSKHLILYGFGLVCVTLRGVRIAYVMHGRLGLYLPTLPYLTLPYIADFPGQFTRWSRPLGPHNAITSLVAAEISPTKTNLPLFPVVISNNRSRGQMTNSISTYSLVCIIVIAHTIMIIIIVFPLLRRFPPQLTHQLPSLSKATPQCNPSINPTRIKIPLTFPTPT